MNERVKLTQIIVQAIEEFPKVHKFLTSGDTGCHPQHFVDTIARRILAGDKKGGRWVYQEDLEMPLAEEVAL